MTYFDPAPTQDITDIPSPPAFPKGKGVVETARLWMWLPLMMVELCGFFCGNKVLPGAVRRIRTLRRIVTTLYRMERQNFSMTLLRALKDNPVWQAQVREDLGGERALKRWLARENRRKARSAHTTRKSLKPMRPSRTRDQKPRIVTDRYGLFRLAPVTSKRQHQYRKDMRTDRVRSLSMFTFKWPAPVPVTPQDLRPVVDRNSKDPTVTDPKIKSPQKVIEIWEVLYGQFLRWSHRLMTADLALTLPAFREDMIPP